MTSFENGTFWFIVVADLLFLRVPIVVGGVWGVRPLPEGA